MWGELGIEPTADAAAIRRAYAHRLRAIDPDSDPAAFQRLREAYEAALAGSARDTGRKPRRRKAQRVPAGDPVLPEAAPPPEPPASPPRATRPATVSPPPPRADHKAERPQDIAERLQRYRAEAQPVLSALERALDDRDALRALALFDEAIAKGILPLTPDPRLLERLTEALTDDPTVPAETFRRVLRTFGWDSYVGRGHAKQGSLASSIGRLKAAAWYAQLRADAGERRLGARDAERNIARVILGRNRLLPRFAGKAVKSRLRAELAQYDQHRPWLDGRVDAARIEWLREKTRQKAAGGARGRFFTIVFFLVVVSNLLRACFEAPRILHTAPDDAKAPITGR